MYIYYIYVYMYVFLLLGELEFTTEMCVNPVIAHAHTRV